ncbi:DUF1254 domain-containing protein [Bradyrhizobium elkanii]|uniref:DUF1254 domain-containing protein n=1 Tax=Bradyrhizobium elkanii TaxID=29448 RepID=A0A4U6RCX6_BRAEL|nr:DUF1254 domain-containing protein [Bradyrhizobium elkanii]
MDNYRVQYSYFVDRNGSEYKAPWNTLYNNARVYTPDDRAIQTPNSDTPYSYVGADLRAEPLVFTVPAVEKSRYYSLQFIDQYTFNFAYVGSRATGNGPGSYLLAGPGWKGETPKGIAAVLRSETDFAFVLYRTQLLGPDDIDNVKKVQAGYKVQPLSQFLGKPAPAAAPAIDFVKPLTPQQQKNSPEFFNVLNSVLQFCPVNPSESGLRARFAKFGIVPGKPFNADQLAPDIRQAVQDGIADAWKKYEAAEKKMTTGEMTSADLFGTRAFLKNDYLKRMTGAVDGIYGNSKEEAFYPGYAIDSAGQRLDGTTGRYTLTFARGQLPPVNAFWSLTMYDLPSRYLVANPLHRYLVNSPMLPNLKKNADGGLTLYVQRESPGTDKESNWLPAPNGPFVMALRLYWPKAEAFNGKWKRPLLQRVADDAVGAAQAAAGGPVPVTVDNFARAESDLYFGNNVKDTGGTGKLFHHREPMSIDKQMVIRANRDTLYSSGVFDLDAGPVTLTLPDAGKRFRSLMAVNEDHYVVGNVEYRAGSFTYDRAKAGTRYLLLALRTLVDPNDPKDVAQVHALQNAIKVSQKDPGKFEVPNWDQVSQKRIRDALLVLNDYTGGFAHAFGSKEQVDPVRHLIGTAAGWGGNPDKDASYLSVTPSRNDGTTVYKLTVRDVPVDAFWSISVYDAKGYFEKNPYDAYTLNNITAKKSADGSIAIQFGGCDGKIPNCLPIMKGWNYTVRLYRPHPEILNGKWKFPAAQAVN